MDHVRTGEVTAAFPHFPMCRSAPELGRIVRYSFCVRTGRLGKNQTLLRWLS